MSVPKPTDTKPVAETAPKPTTTIGEAATITEAPVSEPAQVIGFPFGEPAFSIPERAFTSNRGSRLVATVSVPLTAFGLEVETAVWLTEKEDKAESCIVQDYSCSLPRSLRAVKDSTIGSDTVKLFKAHVMGRFDQWSSNPAIAAKLEAPKVVKATDNGRLVRRKPLVGSSTANPAVQSVSSAAK